MNRNLVADPFIVHSLGRSRSAWLSTFLTYCDVTCHHEQTVTWRSVAEAARFLSAPFTGTVESAASPGWPLIREVSPRIREVVIRRPIDEVMESFRGVDVSAIAVYDFDLLRRNLVRMDRCLTRLASRPGVLVIEYADLVREDTCAAIFEHCLPYDFDRGWWEELRDRNIQVDVVEHVRYFHAHRAQIEAFKSECKAVLRSTALARRAATRKAA